MMPERYEITPTEAVPSKPAMSGCFAIRPLKVAAFALPALYLSACIPSDPARQAEALSVSPEVIAARQLQMRSYDTADPEKLLSASAQLLQDLGFTLGEANSAAGLLVASKDRSAVETGQVVGQVIIVLLAAAGGVAVNPIYERNQKIRVLVVARLGQNGRQSTVRATFQRVIWNNQGQISRELTIDDPKIYQEFFNKLSQSVFLTGNAI